MLQDAHSRKENLSISISGPGDNVIVSGDTDRWIYVHEIIGDFDANDILEVKAGTTVLATFDLDEGQGITLTDEPGEDNRPRFECPPGQDFILAITGSSTFTGNVNYSFRQ